MQMGLQEKVHSPEFNDSANLRGRIKFLEGPSIGFALERIQNEGFFNHFASPASLYFLLLCAGVGGGGGGGG